MTIEIPLTQGQVAIVDDIDADLAQFKWHALFNPDYANGGGFVAVRHIAVGRRKQATERMHRVILTRKLGRPLLSSEEVDHWNTQPLNNQRDNLRLATRGQNGANQSRRKDNTSGFKGVSWNKANRKWSAHIRINGKTKYLGSFDNAIDAYARYCAAAIELFGEFARLE